MKSRKPLRELQPLLELGPGGVWMNLVDDDHKRHLLRYSEMQNTFKPNEKVMELLDYRHKKIETNDISEKECVEDEDALRLMMMICGGYVQDDFAIYLSYNDFQEKKEEFQSKEAEHRANLKNLSETIKKMEESDKIKQKEINDWEIKALNLKNKI